MPILAALLLTAVPALAMGQGDPGGSLTVEVPPGAAPAGTTIRVESRQPDERPDELASLPMTRAFHELLPSDVRFSAPVTVTRSVAFEELGIEEFRPGRDGLILGSLFTRDIDGTWSWLTDSEIRLHPDDSAFTVTATTDHGGPIVAAIAGDMIVATEDATGTSVGEGFRVEGQLRVDPGSRAAIADVTGRTSDETIARPVRSYAVEGFDRAAGLELECLAPGTIGYEATFAVTSVADVGPLRDAIGLAGTDIAVTLVGEHTCGA